MRKAIMVVGIGLIAALLPSAPAVASHRLDAVHQPQPIALEGEDLNLPFVVRGCWMFCTPIDVRVTFFNNRRGRWISTSQMAVPGPDGTAVTILTIPGRFLHATRFRYFATVSQTHCDVMGPCHELQVRNPVAGVHEVPVLIGP